MPDPRFERVERIFREAVRLEPDARGAFLDGACEGDAGLRAEVDALLREDADPLIPEPASLGLMDVEFEGDGPAPPAPEVPGFAVGRVLGVGGMGIVYEAEQQRPRRRVALKVLRPGSHTRDRLKRFELEAELLARLTHPAIAQIYDAGATGDGRPYFAMELVEGRPITEHARSAGLDAEERLALFLIVCEGVQHAHQQGVIHRDIKPSNILVTPDGRVKILDFGIARATDADIQSVTLHTGTGQLLGTLAYMSPEQASGDPGAIDTRTDVYSLGLLLFELLTGRRPRELNRLAFPDAIQAVLTGEPTRLSSLDRRLRGDLETITAKALEHEKARRYASVSELGDDVRHHLKSEPIMARPPSAAYQIRKFARRNRALVAGVVAVILALAAGLVGTTIALGRAHRAQIRTNAALDEAQRQSRIAEAVNAFLNEDLLGAADPEVNPVDHELTVREAVDRAASGIEGRFKDEPVVEAAIRTTIADVYFNLADYKAAEEQTRRALALRTGALGPDAKLTLQSRSTLANCLQFDKRLDEAEPLMVSLVADARRALGPDDPQTIYFVSDLASLYAEEAKYDEASELIEDNLARATRTLGADSEPAKSALDTLAGLRFRTGKFTEAVALFQQILDGYERAGEGESADAAAYRSSLALCLQRAGEPEKAEPLARRALAEHEHIFGPDHRYTQKVKANLGLLYIDLGRYDEAERLLREVNDQRIATIGRDHPETLVTEAMLGRVLVLEGRYEEAEDHLIFAATKFEEIRGPDHPYTKIAIKGCVALYEKWGKPEAAAKWRAKLPPDEAESGE